MAKKKSWDSILKRLIHVNPPAFVQWLIPNAVFLSEQPSELESLKREVDVLLEVMIDRQRMLLHIEFQTYNDTTMAERLLLYNVLARNVHKLPVFSCVIYLLKDGPVQQSPLRIAFPDGTTIHEFHFESIEIGQLAPDNILNTGFVALIPLLPLIQGGASREVIERMFVELKKQREAETQITELEVRETFSRFGPFSPRASCQDSGCICYRQSYNSHQFSPNELEGYHALREWNKKKQS